jgi:hypothetical protein
MQKSVVSSIYAIPATLLDQIWNMIIKGSVLKSECSLGIWHSKTGDTTESVQKRAFLLGSRIDCLNLPTQKNDKIIQAAVDSLIVPVYQFGILENKCSPETYNSMGFAWCDAKQLLFVSE